MNRHFAYVEDDAHNYVGRELCDCGVTGNHWIPLVKTDRELENAETAGVA